MFNRKISYLLDRIRVAISLPAFIALLLLFVFCCGIKYYYAPNYLEYRPVHSIHEVKVVADKSMEKSLEHLNIPSDTVFEHQDNSYTPIKPSTERRQLRILVTGGTGFVGSHLVDKLMKEGHEVTVLDNFITGRKQNVEQWNGNPNFELIEHDVIDHYYTELDQIYHLASPALSSHYMHDPTVNMLSLARLVKARILLISTSEEYEDSRVEIRNARIFNTFGPRMHINGNEKVVSNFILQALQDQPITIYGDGRRTQSFLYVDDLVDGLIALMNSDISLPINVGNSEEYTIEDLAYLITCLAGSKSGVIHNPKEEEDERVQEIPDITRATELLNWKPKTLIQDGIIKTLEYFQKELEKNISEVFSHQTYQNISETEMEFSYNYEMLFKCLNLKNQTTFPFFDLPLISWREKRHVFRSIADFVVADNLDDFKPEKVKCGDIIFVKTNFIEKFLLEYHRRIRNPYVLLTHESDYGVGYPWQIEILNDSKIIKWYAQNTLSSHPILVPIPSGIQG